MTAKTMKHVVGFVAGVTVLVGGLAGSASAVTGSQRFTLTFTGGDTGKVFAAGVLNASGTDIQLSSTDNPDGSSSGVDRFVFPQGTLTVTHFENPGEFSFNPRSCVGRFSFTGTFTVTGGTGAYAGATGSGTDVGSGIFVVKRNPDGSCSEEEAFSNVVVRATGTLSVPGQAAAA